jgi:hypothetical protein
MHKFKAGDKVQRIYGEFKGMKVGDVGIVKGLAYFSCMTLEGYDGEHTMNNFKLVDEKESTSAWLKENPWYIKVNGKQEFLAAVKWLEDHGQVAELSNSWLDGVEALRSSNNMVSTYIRTDMTCVSKETEIILNFKVVVKSVKLPEAPKPTEQESQQKLRIIELEATIAKAQEQVKKIKGEM